MAKVKTFYVYILCFLICSSAFSQSNLTGSGNATDELLATSAQQRDCLREVYLSQVGVREHGPANHGAQVKAYLESVGLPQGYPWCAAFVSWCFQQVDIPVPKSAWVPSYALRDKMVYKQGKVLQRLPKYGDVMLIWYNSLNRPAHIGFVDHWGERWIISVEGNTNLDGSREGDGVYRKRRLKKQVWAVVNFIDDDPK